MGRSSLRPGPHRFLPLPRLERGSRRFFPGPPRLAVPVLAMPLLPWLKPRRRAPVPARRQTLWQQRPTLHPRGLRPPAAASELPATHTPFSLPGSVWPTANKEYRSPTPSLSHLLSSGRACSHSLATDVPISHPVVYHTPQLRRLPCMVLITGGALDTTPRHISMIFSKAKKLSPRGVVSSVFYTVRASSQPG